ncbi:LptA/OstA family protein [Lichenicoccus sp.]|uniref:LptA/OstA family protein n=1 Tax=Lichenicoccus sp. TaxID=2781899 RepID=UPI003D0D1EE8
MRRLAQCTLSPLALALAVLVSQAAPARGQAIDLSHGGQITVTALGGFDWDQKAQIVTAYREAQAVRGGVTVTADRLRAYYRKKAVPPGAAAKPVAAKPGSGPANDDTGANEIYRLEAIGHVHIFTATDQAFGDHAIYDIDQAVLVMTGHDLHLTTPTQLLTARDVMEYWSQTRMSVGRGNASVTTNDGRRLRGDILVGYSAPNTPPPAGTPSKAQGKATAASAALAKPGSPADDPIQSSGKLKLVHAFGHVVVRTQTETVTGDRGVYVPDTGIARIVGNVHITRGQNQLNGAAAIVNMHTGLATMTEDPGALVRGLIVPNDNNSPPGSKPAAAAAPAGAKSAASKPAPSRPATP